MGNNQVENQVDLIFNDNFSENEENIVCNIYKEQFDLINELPEEERLKVLYISVLRAFYDREIKNQNNQVENQVDYTYIYNSIYISIYNSLSNYSKTLIKLLFKTINCKNYKNWGGKRKNSGRKKTTVNNSDVIFYGEYMNVGLPKGYYDKLTTQYLSKELVEDAIKNLGIAITTGKEKSYTDDLPFAHYERLRAFINYRKTHPNKENVKILSAAQRKAEKIKELFGGN